MKAPSLEDSQNYCGIVDSNPKFEATYEALAEWFDSEFDHVEGENKELTLAFYEHLEYKMEIKPGFKSIKDIDASVEFTGELIPSSVENVYSKYKKPSEEPERANRPMVW